MKIGSWLINRVFGIDCGCTDRPDRSGSSLRRWIKQYARGKSQSTSFPYYLAQFRPTVLPAAAPLIIERVWRRILGFHERCSAIARRGGTRGRRKYRIRTRIYRKHRRAVASRMRYGKRSEMRGEVKQKGTESTDGRASAAATRAHAEFVIELPGEFRGLDYAGVCMYIGGSFWSIRRLH